MYKIISESVENTIELGKMISKKLNIGDILVLSGDLGTGKTYFTKGILQNFTDINEVSSPTFTIVNEYSTIPPIYHFDIYRLNDINEFINIGGEEYFENGICVIEWGEKIANILPKEYIQINFLKIDKNKREIEIIPLGIKYEKYIKEIFFNENTST